ncbi:hypothetical protein SAMN05428989_1003 [Pseudoxanthomonas sp. GM95]|uniref:hypothetical protein n=1 Tax=Pseudoxanthomonas sp. GM95 TaxID=1881043 RepID=UPI0008B176C9|nr:hypothetical protein [Pseudoxanthomonas sp. GM95]SEK88650.1 hypothetical protein SAMN05428989_1003 [Pseudoxanthomonas sp. GM95]
MLEFLSVALHWPTLPYSIVLGFSVAYWLLAATGIVDADGLHGGDGFHHGELHHGGDAHGISGMFARLGLGGAPVMLVVALVAFFGWTVTYFGHLLFLQNVAAPVRWGLGSVLAAVALVPGVIVSAVVLRPIRRLLLKLRPVEQASILGRAGVIASPHADTTTGRATVDDGGAGLILQVRTAPGTTLIRGDRVLLVDYDAALNLYHVIREQEALLPAAPGPRLLP